MKIFFFLGVLLLGFFTCFCQQTSFFDSRLLKCVVSIEQLNSSTSSVPIGTGFLVGSPKNHLLLVTAKHVIIGPDGNFNPNLAWRLNEKTNVADLVKDSDEQARVGGWFASPDSDIACRFVEYANNSDFVSLPTSFMLAQTNLEVGAHTLILGFPMGLRSEQYPLAIARSGIVARTDKSELMLDSFVFPGNSGGPVLYSPWVKIGPPLTGGLINDERLIGVVVDYLPYSDFAISAQTKRPRVIFEENSGLCQVVPVDKLFELLDRTDFKMADADPESLHR